MAGIYIHIPFCKTRCIYCGFYSTTLRGWGARYVDSLIIEHRLREGYIAAGEVQTVYVGGGTPSQLDYDSFRRLLDHFAPLAADTEQREVTVECNPDDVTPALATLLYNARVNRVSMGVQTFDDA
ncbi:MAG: radical SAM protein, partial [Oscillospiraceae bacterium]|nr:radical SAM protein [Oscillospiraceae bacterium]